MTIGDNSYGTVAGVAALAGMWTNDGSFDETTRPTEAQVESWIDNISGIINMLLAQEGFKIPVTQADAVLMLKQFVQEAVADLCAYANGSGRFYSERMIERGYSTTQIITRDFTSWVETHSTGLENLGATRTTTEMETAATRETDENGNEVDPLFTRSSFGEDHRSLGR